DSYLGTHQDQAERARALDPPPASLEDPLGVPDPVGAVVLLALAGALRGPAALSWPARLTRRQQIMTCSLRSSGPSRGSFAPHSGSTDLREGRLEGVFLMDAHPR